MKLGLNFTDNGNRYEIETMLELNRYEIETTLGHNFTENCYSEHISSSPHTEMQKKEISYNSQSNINNSSGFRINF